MDKYGEGLNCVPFLKQNITPPCSGRSGISLIKKRSQRSLICYNGNYEGDRSMFKEKEFEIESLSLIDTESETEFSTCSVLKTKATIKTSSLAWRFLEFLLMFLKPDLREKCLIYLEKFMETALYKKLAKCSNFISFISTYIFYITTIFLKKLTYLWHFFWRRRKIFRNTSRSLLWWLTFAKCNDLSLFLLILLSTPVLFILALFGFVISFCGSLKDVLHSWRSMANLI